MGSPYSIAKSNTVHVVKTSRGFTKIFEIVAATMSFEVTSRGDRAVCRYALHLVDGPERVILNSLYSTFQECLSKRSRTVVTLAARYDWDDFEKFARTIIFDFSSSKELVDAVPPMLFDCVADVEKRASWDDSNIFDPDCNDWSISSPVLAIEWEMLPYNFAISSEVDAS